MFTKMDLIVGYHQVHMQVVDTWKTILKTKFRLFKWMVMPFGLTNVPTTFMWLINDISKPHLGKFGIICLDDFLIFSRYYQDHLQCAQDT